VDLVYGLELAMASSSTSESDSLPVSSAVQSTKVLRDPIQTTEKWRWKFFCTLCGEISAMRLYALPSAVAVALQNCFIQVGTLCDADYTCGHACSFQWSSGKSQGLSGM